MPSDHAGPPDPLARLADVLAEAGGGVRPTPLELAELLWLARRMEPAADGAATPSAEPERPPLTSPEAAPQDPPDPPPLPPPDPTPPVDPPAAPAGPVPLYLPDPGARTGPYASLLAPAPPMLRHPLGLQRALRPLKRHTDAPTGHRLDEGATADRIARLGAAPEWWLPVLGPARERWLRLNLVHDTGPTMPVWRPLIRELHTALAQSGVFRTITLAAAGADGTAPGVPAPADGRTVTLVVSDCMGAQWRPGEAGTRWQRTLRHWASRMPVAVVQPLPEHLWRDTALPAEPGLLTAPFRAAPSATLAFAPYDGDPTAPYADPDADRHAVPLPVLEPGPDWLANWAKLLASPGGVALPGSAALLGRRPDPATRTDLARLSPEDLVLRFRATSSRAAFRLAGHLALGRPHLPVMRLVQRAVEPDPRPQHLAEVILSGLLTTAPGPPGSYTFRPGVQDLLLRGLPRSARARTSQLLARMGEFIEERAGSTPGEFRAVTPAAADGSGSGTADGAPFATVRPESVRRLTGGGAAPRELAGGRYRLLERLAPARTVWRAEDREGHRPVVVRLHGAITDATRREAFLRDAERLRGLRHPNVVTVHDVGFTGDRPFVVMEHLDGIPLNALAAPGGYWLPPPLAVSVGTQLASALTAVHGAGIVHGGLGMSRTVLLPDGRIKLSLFEPGRTDGQEGRAGDLHALADLMLHLTTGSSRVHRPYRPEQLHHLPPPLQLHYTYAVSLLTSPTPTRQERGAALLGDAAQQTAARESYDPRHYRLLGPVTVERNGAQQPLGLFDRAMLAMLLLKDGRTVTHEELRGGLWARGELPRNPMAALGRTAARITAALGPGALATLPDGYALHTSADRVDLREWAELERTAEVVAAEGDLGEARDRVDAALSLWHAGEPLAGLPGPAAQSARVRLTQLRHALYVKRAELDLELGEYDRAATDLAELLRAHPAREDYRRLLLVALRNLGRIDEALEVFQEYEWSGGDNPELLALGHELRGDYVYGEDTDEDAGEEAGWQHQARYTPYPNRPEEGVFPTEDDLPSLLYGDDPPEADAEPLPRDEVPEGFRVAVLVQCGQPAPDPDDRALLGRAVSRLLVAGGLDPADYELWERPDGYSLLLRAGVSELPLLAVTLREFGDRVAETGGRGWRVTFVHAPGGDGEDWRPGAGWVDRVREAGAQGLVAVSDPLRRALADSGYEGPALRMITATSPDDGWYLLAHVPPAESVHPVHGPFRLPARVPLPPPANSTRSVVYTAYGPGLTIQRPATPTFYYEVDLTERRLEVAEPGPAVDGSPTFRVAGGASWRITDPIAAVRPGSGQLATAVLTGHLRECLNDVCTSYPPTLTSQAESELHARLARLPLPGHTVQWSLGLTPAHAPGLSPRLTRPERALADTLRAADAVLLGFDGTLTRLAVDAAHLVHRYEPAAAGDCEDPLDLLRGPARHLVDPRMAEELSDLEVAAADTSEPVPYADLLLRTLAAEGMPLAVVTDRSAGAAAAYLRRRRLLDCLPGGVHGRDPLGTPVIPDPRPLLGALRQLGVDRRAGLLIGSLDVERDAAREAGVPFLRVQPASLLPLLRAARTL